MPKQEQLGERLAQLRRERAVLERKDLNAYDIAKAVGVSQPTYSRYEANITIPDDKTLARIAEYHGVSRSWLRYGEGERVPVTKAVEVVAGPAPRPSRAAASPTKRQTGGR